MCIANFLSFGYTRKSYIVPLFWKLQEYHGAFDKGEYASGISFFDFFFLVSVYLLSPREKVD